MKLTKIKLIPGPLVLTNLLSWALKNSLNLAWVLKIAAMCNLQQKKYFKLYLMSPYQHLKIGEMKVLSHQSETSKTAVQAGPLLLSELWNHNGHLTLRLHLKFSLSNNLLTAQIALIMMDAIQDYQVKPLITLNQTEVLNMEEFICTKLLHYQVDAIIVLIQWELHSREAL